MNTKTIPCLIFPTETQNARRTDLPAAFRFDCRVEWSPITTNNRDGKKDIGTFGRSACVATSSPGLTSPSREETQDRTGVQQMMQRVQHILPFLVLFALRYIHRHAVGIAFFMANTLVIIQLNRWDSGQVSLKGDQDR